MFSAAYSGVKRKIQLCYQGIINIPNWFKETILGLINYCRNCKYKFMHLKETNFELGMEHLYKKNLNDALLRFKFIEKFLSPADSLVNYWLGWTYFLKDNYPKALYHLQKSNESEAIALSAFLSRNGNNTEIPELIWKQYRDLTAGYYSNKFLNENNTYLSYNFVRQTLDQIVNLPETYNVLELGSNVGLVGYELCKRFPDNFTLVGVESSDMMNKLLEQYYPSTKMYDQIFNISISDFIKQCHNKFEIILSFCGLSFTNDLKSYFASVYALLNEEGYFALCLPSGSETILSLKRKEFVFSTKNIQDALSKTNFEILNITELTVAENYKYCMVVCKKTILDKQ